MNPIQNMFLGIAIGDAFGAGYEFAHQERDKFHDVDLNVYKIHPNPDFGHEQGRYTDDTQMSIAVAELLASGLEFNHQNLADYFVDTYKKYPIPGYAKGFQAFLDSVSDGSEFISKIKPYSERNGAAMRAVPIGIVDGLETVVHYARINAEVTHNTPKGVDSSVAVALMSHYNFHYGSIPDVIEIVPHLEDEETIDYLYAVSDMKEIDSELLFGQKYKDRGVPCDGMRTAGAVLYILNRYDKPEDVLVESIRLGGDTDSVASISLGINMIHHKIDELPKQLYDGLINNEYGKDYLIELGDRLAQN